LPGFARKIQPELKEEAVSTVVRGFCTTFVISTLVGVFGTGSALAEKWDCSGSKKSKQIISIEVIGPGDRPDRALVQLVRVDVFPDGSEETVYEHDDQIGGTGTHSGYSVINLKSGERLWTKYEGVHYTVPKGDAWESRFQGVFRFIAGTGKYKAIRGGGHYQGIGTRAGSTSESVCEAEY